MKSLWFITVALSFFAVAQTQPVPALTFVAGPDGLTGPATAQAGYVRLALENQTDQERAHGIFRVKDGADLDAAKQLTVDEFSGALTPKDLEARYQTLVGGFYGGAVFIAPDETKEVLVTLDPGLYVVYADYINAQGGPSLEPEQVMVLEMTPAHHPAVSQTPDYTVKMVDHAFALPADIQAGRHLWRVENIGHQEHFMFVSRMLPGKTLADVTAFLRGEGAPAMEDINQAVGVHALTPGLSNDVWLELTPGEYAAICFITDPESGLPHAMLGMTQTFMVNATGGR